MEIWFFESRAWGRKWRWVARGWHPMYEPAGRFRAVWPMGWGNGTTALGSFKACLGRPPSRFLPLLHDLVTPSGGGEWMACGAAGAKIYVFVILNLKKGCAI